MVEKETRTRQAARLRILAELTERIGREIAGMDGPHAREMLRIGQSLGIATDELQVIAQRLEHPRAAWR